MNFKGNSLQNPILNRRQSKPISNKTVTRHRPAPATFITETPDLRKASVFSDSTWEAGSEIYQDSDDEDDDRSHLGVEEVLKVLYERECKKLGVCPVGAFLRSPSKSSLNLRNYSLGPRGAAALAVPLLLDSSVTSVDLEGNGIGAEGLRNLTGSLLESNYITHINLTNNKIGHRGISLIKQLLLTNFYVTHINLSDNQFTDTDATSFAQIIKENKHLKELLLSKNDFGEFSGKVLGPEIASNDSLELLDLSWNHIRGKGAIALANAVKENVGLKTLRLAFNGFGTDGGAAMGEALTANRTLRELDVSNNRIMDNAVKELSAGIANNDSLEILKIGVNPFTLPSALLIIEAVGRNESGSLRHLDMKDVSVTREFLAVVSDIKESRDFTVIHGLKSKIRLIPPDPPPVLERSESQPPGSPTETINSGEEEKMNSMYSRSVKSDAGDNTDDVSNEQSDNEEIKHGDDPSDTISDSNSEDGNRTNSTNNDDERQQSANERENSPEEIQESRPESSTGSHQKNPADVIDRDSDGDNGDAGDSDDIVEVDALRRTPDADDHDNANDSQDYERDEDEDHNDADGAGNIEGGDPDQTFQSENNEMDDRDISITNQRVLSPNVSEDNNDLGHANNIPLPDQETYILDEISENPELVVPTVE